MSAPASLSARLTARVGALSIDASFDTAGGTLVVVGPNGSGKTTLLSLVLGVRPVTQGRIEVAGTVLLDTERAIDVPIEHRRLGYVPQDYALFPHLTVRDNIAFALGSIPDRPGRAERAERVAATLGELGLEEHADRLPGALSGGEKQRVALARALSIRPRALLLDEPLAALDVSSRRTVRRLLAETLRRLALPTIVVTHDPADATELGDRIAVLQAGTIVQSGGWADLVARPATPFVEAFVAS